MARKFVMISQNTLAEKIEKAWNINGDTSRYAWPELTPQIKKDLKKCAFDCENVETGPPYPLRHEHFHIKKDILMRIVKRI